MEDTNTDTFFDDTGESQDAEDKRIRKAAFKANFKKGGRNIAILIGAVVVIGAYSVFSGPDEQASQDSSAASVLSRSRGGDIQDADVNENSPIAQRQQEARREQVTEAASQGNTYIEQVTLRNENRAEELRVEEASNPTLDTGDIMLETIGRAAPRSGTTPVSNPNVNRGQTGSNGKPEGWTLKDEIDEARGYAEQVVQDLKIVAQAQSQYGGYEEYVHRRDKMSQEGGGDSGEQSIPFVAGGFGESLEFNQNPSGESPATFKIPPDTHLLGITTVGHDSDVGGPMSFESVTPPLDGAVFLAENVERTGEAVTPQITKMIYKGNSYDVKALVVNAETFQPGLASDVDHHYLSRWVPYLAGIFGGAYAESLTDQTTTTTPEGATNTQTNSPNANDQIAFTVGTGLGRAVPILQDQINRPITVTVNYGEEVGIWILSDIEVIR
jgi:type IV secretory pathway VirB10-like protein